MSKKSIGMMIWGLCLVLILGLSGMISFPQYDTQEASDTLGKIYSLKENWTVTYDDNSFD